MKNRLRPLALALALTSSSAGCRFWVLASGAPPDAATLDDRASMVAVDSPAPVDASDAPAPVDAPDAPAPIDAPDAPAPALDCEAERAAIVGAAGRFEVGANLFSPVVVTSAGACPLLVSSEGRPFAGFAERGRGRVVVVGHENALAQLAGAPSFEPVLLGALRWAGRRTLPRIGIDRGTAVPAFVDWWIRQGGAVQTLSASALRTAAVDVWASGGATAPTSAADVAAVRAFVDGGGGVLLAGQSWTWARTFRQPAERFPGNAHLAGSGLLIAPATMSTIETTAGAAVRPPRYANTDAALALLGDHLRGIAPLPGGDLQGISRVLGDAVDHLPIAAPQVDTARRLAVEFPPAAPTVNAPVAVAVAPVDALLHRVAGRVLRDGPLAWLGASSAAAEFPGSTTAAPTRRTVIIDARAVAPEAGLAHANSQAAQWRSTGLYAIPGARVTIEVPGAATTAGLAVQIGVHDRALWPEGSWNRTPELVRREALDRAIVVTANPYGGMIEVLVPVGADLGRVSFTIEGAAEAPEFIAGVTAPASWRQRVAENSVPWTSLQGRALRIVVPTDAARAVTDPDALMRFWDEVMDSMADLAGTPRARARAEIVVFDRQVPNGGSVDPGYPTTRSLTAAGLAMDLVTLRRSGDWGTFFGLGQGHVSRDWVIPGSDDALPNLFSLYAFERVLGIGTMADPPAHGSLTAPDRAFRRRRYFEQGRNFARDWNSFTALETYLQITETLGYRVLTDTFIAYRPLGAGDRPRDPDARVQQWATRTSTAAGLDLSPFYDAWELPLTAATRAATRALPAWSRPAPLP